MYVSDLFANERSWCALSSLGRRAPDTAIFWIILGAMEMCNCVGWVWIGARKEET
jgi:hypothetical protein